tara:strand:+ start:3161 stop:3478 length:318 start_codon:yes stop_codon:yes gene_type:complete
MEQILSAILKLLNVAIEFIEGFFDELLKLMMYVPRTLVSRLVDALLAVVESIPVPDFVSNAGSIFGGISPHVWWFASALEFGFGLGVIITAYLIRFGLRFLPFVF